MADDNQLSFGDGLLSGRRKISKLSKHLDKLDQIIDTHADSVKKGGRYYFGYKGHVGVDIGSKLIRKVCFTIARYLKIW